MHIPQQLDKKKNIKTPKKNTTINYKTHQQRAPTILSYTQFNYRFSREQQTEKHENAAKIASSPLKIRSDGRANGQKDGAVSSANSGCGNGEGVRNAVPASSAPPLRGRHATGEPRTRVSGKRIRSRGVPARPGGKKLRSRIFQRGPSPMSTKRTVMSSPISTKRTL